jgi:hypothetical protein
MAKTIEIKSMESNVKLEFNVNYLHANFQDATRKLQSVAIYIIS